MRLVIPIIVASLAGLIGCTTVHPDAIRAVGAVWTVSHDDIRQAVAATGSRAKEIAWVDVINRNKIEVYFRPLPSNGIISSECMEHGSLLRRAQFYGDHG